MPCRPQPDCQPGAPGQFRTGRAERAFCLQHGERSCHCCRSGSRSCRQDALERLHGRGEQGRDTLPAEDSTHACDAADHCPVGGFPASGSRCSRSLLPGQDFRGIRDDEAADFHLFSVHPALLSEHRFLEPLPGVRLRTLREHHLGNGRTAERSRSFTDTGSSPWCSGRVDLIPDRHSAHDPLLHSLHRGDPETSAQGSFPVVHAAA